MIKCKQFIIKAILGIFFFNTFFGITTYSQGDTMYIEGRHLYSAAGEKIILRGVNEMYVWSSDTTGSWSMAEIAKTGANCVRLVWSETGNTQHLVTLMNNCIANKMIAMPECHDATGKWKDLDKCINFWNNPIIKQAINKNKKWTLLNIGNEVGDGSVTAEQFETEYKRAIDSIRSWEYKVPIVIDASNWGQDVDIIFDTWEALLNHDPFKNVLFSVHSYWENTENYERVVQESLNEGLPIIIGEGPSITRYPTCEILDFETGLKLLGENEIGWLSWSWGLAKNGHCKPDFDHTSDGKFGNWETKNSEILMVSHEHSLMRSSERPASFFKDNKIPAVRIVTLPSESTLKVGDTLPLDIIISPANVSEKDYSIALIQEGRIVEKLNENAVKALSTGTAIVEVTHKASGLKDRIIIEVE